MLKHADIWRSIDRLAAKNGCSVSGLARRAGLDPTVFNKSKRMTFKNRPRWPSTESIAKVLTATGTSFGEFVAFASENGSMGIFQNIPLVGLVQAGNDGFFDDMGYPVGYGWDEISFPDVGDSCAYALEISGDSMYPAFRHGDRVIVSPQSALRRGDRVVVKTRQGEVMAKELVRATARKVELKSLNPDYEDRVFATEEVAWIARIIWASQ